MNSKDIVIQFLRELLPDKEKATKHIYNMAFKKNFVTGVKLGKNVAGELKILKQAENAARKLEETLSDLPKKSARRIEKDSDMGLEDLRRALRAIQEESELSECWVRGNTPRGPQDVVAYHIASRVLQAMVDLDLDIKCGTPANSNKPNTLYGKIVEEALDHHGRNSDWRRPAEAVFKEYKSSKKGEHQ